MKTYSLTPVFMQTQSCGPPFKMSVEEPGVVPFMTAKRLLISFKAGEKALQQKDQNQMS